MNVARAHGARRNLAQTLLLTLGLVALAGCAGGAPTPVPAASEPAGTSPAAYVPPARADLAMANLPRLPASAAGAQRAAALANAFAFDLYRAIGSGKENTVFSPESIAIALAMTRAGAKGETAAQMDTAMHGLGSDAGAADLASLDAAIGSISGPWRDPGGADHPVTVRVANAAFAQRDLAFVQAYLDALASRFGAGVRLVDYRQDAEAARNQINAWVDGQTEHRIRELLARGTLTPMSRLTLVNAIYLKAPWLIPFFPDGTKDAPFTKLDGSIVDVPTMHATRQYGYASGSGWKAVELAYGGGRLAMTIVVPDSLTSFEKSLDAAAFDRIVAGLRSQEVQLALPKFKAETTVDDLGDRLAAMGMPLAFTDRADFGGMTTAERLFIAFVVHQANIDVDENGTEAAAATAAGMAASALPSGTAVLTVDRPFVYAIRDVQTGAILFMGRIVDPSIR